MECNCGCKEKEQTMLSCHNKRCWWHDEGKCLLPVEEIKINSVGECAKERWGRPK